MLPAFAALAVTPLAFCYASSFEDHAWKGFYRAPYFRDSVEQKMAEALGRHKKSNHDVYFDASADERRRGFLGEMFVFAGSVFTTTPSRYEQTGIGYRLSEEVVARRFAENSRIWRLLPGAAEAVACGWYYSRPFEDMALAPLLVRSRFDKLIAEGYLVERHRAGKRVLFSFDKPTTDLDHGIERYWRPRIVAQASGTDVDGDGRGDLVFYDHAARKILAGDQALELPPWLRNELGQLYVASLPGEPKIDFLVGRLRDTYFKRGKRLAELVEQQPWGWTIRDSASAAWAPEQAEWLWDWDIPVVGDLDHDGADTLIAYRPRTKQWITYPRELIPGPTLDPNEFPIPLVGRFFEGSTGDLGLWGLATGSLTLASTSNGRTATLHWGGRAGDVLVPGDYDGDGYDEIAIWQRTNWTWYWRRAPNGPISQATFGTESAVPIPADYDHDGKLDLAYWEPAAAKIFVSLDRGASVDRTIQVPDGSIPSYVNMY